MSSSAGFFAERSTAARLAMGLAGMLAAFLLLQGGARADAPPFYTAIGEPGEGAGQLSRVRDVVTDPVSGHVFVSEGGNFRISEFGPYGNFIRAWGWDVAPDGAPGDTPGDGLETCTEVCQPGEEGIGEGQFVSAPRLALGAGSIYVSENFNSYLSAMGPGVIAGRVQKFDLTGEAVAFDLAIGGDVVAYGPDDSESDETQEVRVVASEGTFSLTFISPLPSEEVASTEPIPAGATAAEVEAALDSLATIGGIGGSVSVGGGPEGGGEATYAVTFESNLGGDDVPELRIDLDEPSGVSTATRGGEPEVCRASAGDVCKSPNAGEEAGQFPGPAGDGFAIATRGDGAVAVGSGTEYEGGHPRRIQIFDPAGSYLETLPDPDELLPEFSEIGDIAIDGAGDYYVSDRFSVSGQKSGVFKLDPAGNVVAPSPFDAENPNRVALDDTSHLYVFDYSQAENRTVRQILGFGPSGDLFLPTEAEEERCQEEIEAQDEECSEFPYESPPAPSKYFRGLSVNAVTSAGGVAIYYTRSSSNSSGEYDEVMVFGPAPTKWAPPNAPLSILSQYAVDAGTSSAGVRARIDEKNAEGTTYYVEYGTGSCASGGCPNRVPLSGEPALGGEGGVALTEVLQLGDLAPQRTYHYRFVARNSEDGTVYGTGEGECAREFTCGEDRVFTTAPAVGPRPECRVSPTPRSGPSALLPNCRAYERVSPADKLGGDIFVADNNQDIPTRLEQAGPAGDALTYSSYRAFADPDSAPYSSQYLARRDGDGWDSEPISPRKEGPSNSPTESLAAQYEAFTEDLGQGWLVQYNDPQPAPGGIPGYQNLYRRLSGPGEYRAVCPTQPTRHPAPEGSFTVGLQGTSADGATSVFQANDKLTGDAVGGENPPPQLYKCRNGALTLVSVLPDGSAAPYGGGVGVPEQAAALHATFVDGVSEDGSRVVWSEAEPGGGRGRLFIRIGDEETRQVGAGGARYWDASPDGSAVLYELGGRLEVYAVDEDARRTIAGEVIGVLGASEDLHRVYFASREDLGGQNSAGEAPVEGEPNLYLHEDGSPVAFIGTLGQRDANLQVSPLAAYAGGHLARVSPDGEAAIFTTAAPLAGSESRAAPGGEPVTEVFRYDAASEEVACISCDPSGARSTGARVVNVLPTATSSVKFRLIGAIVRGAESRLHFSRALSADGETVFFESFEALVPRDENDEEDVYQWQPGSSQEDCVNRLGAERYSPGSKGCLALISSGTAAEGARFVDASADGSDAFFATPQRLAPEDGDNGVDIYDARVGGGFPPPEPRKEPCSGGACQHPSDAPAARGPVTDGGAGPVAPISRSGPCRRLALKTRALSRRAKRLRRAGARMWRRGHRLGSPRRKVRARRRSARLRQRSQRLTRAAIRDARRTRACRKGGAR